MSKSQSLTLRNKKAGGNTALSVLAVNLGRVVPPGSYQKPLNN